MSQESNNFVPVSREAAEQTVQNIIADIDSANAARNKRIAELRKVQEPLPSNVPDYTLTAENKKDPVQQAIENALAPGLKDQRRMADIFRRISPLARLRKTPIVEL